MKPAKDQAKRKPMSTEQLYALQRRELAAVRSDLRRAGIM